MEAHNTSQVVNKSITLANYIEIWRRDVAPLKLAKTTLVREQQDIARILPNLGHDKLKDLNPEIFRYFYAKMQLEKIKSSGRPLAENTVEGLQKGLGV